ncbi:MAG: hypothetical protein ACO28P_08300, partial [Ilumatobacteraceae bacterium]
MTITEADRIDMLAELRRLHGDRLGDIIVQHLPPIGWGDVARISDINRLEMDINRLEYRIDTEIGRLENRIDRLTTVVTWTGGLFVTCFLSLFALIATKF